jgi:hypothetical protein
MHAKMTGRHIELYTAGAFHEKLHLAPHYGRLPDDVAFYILVNGVRVRVERQTASEILEACARSGSLNGRLTGEADSVVRYSPLGKIADIG